MMRWLVVLVPCALLVACGGSSNGAGIGTTDGGTSATGEGGSSSGAGSSSGGGDDASSPREGGASPEGGAVEGGGTVDGGTHDAASGPEGGTDAAPGTDAATADGGPGIEAGPDAASPTCVGAWTMIPPLTVSGAAIAKYDLMTNDDSTVYVAYSRPSDTTFFDVAKYTPAGGWSAYQSAAADDPAAQGKRPVWAMPENGHLAGFSVESDTSVWREVFDFSTQKWSWSSTGGIQPQRAGTAYTRDWIVFEGMYDSPSAGTCETLPSTMVYAIDATSTRTAPSGGDSPLGSLAGPYGIAAGSQVFFFGGYAIPAQSGGCNVSEPRTYLYSGAFYDPNADVWSTGVPLGASAGATYTFFHLAALPSGQVVLFENYTNVYGRADVLAPGQTSFTQTAPLPADLWYRLNDPGNYATIAGTAAGVVVWSTPSGTGVLYDPVKNAMTPICAPPAAVANTYMAATSNGVVLLGDGQLGTNSTTAQSAFVTF